MGTDEEITYQMLPATECSPTLLAGELLHPTAHGTEKPCPTLAGIGRPCPPSTSEGYWLGWYQAHAGVGQKMFQLLLGGKVCGEFGIDGLIEHQRPLLQGSVEGLLRGCSKWCIRNQDIQEDVGSTAVIIARAWHPGGRQGPAP